MNNLLDPAILFFICGVLAGLAKSNLEIPPAIAKFLSMYLLMAIGLKGGFALSHSGFSAEVGIGLGAAVLLAICVPLLGYFLLQRLVSKFDAAAIAATYGSVSAVTFVTAVQYLDSQQISYGGYMAAAMALMESPAIILAVVFANVLRQQPALALSVAGVGQGQALLADRPAGISVGKVLHESFTDGSQFLLLSALVVGFITGDAGKAVMQPFSGDLFKGMLAFFLLDMGLMAARSFSQIQNKSVGLIAYAILGPIVHASFALGLAYLLAMSVGDGALLMILSASASYIAVPAVLRYALPEANPSMYCGLSLGVTFPLNILLGIPFYVVVAQSVLV